MNRSLNTGVDGYGFDSYRVKFAGVVDMDDAAARAVGYGDDVVIVLRGHVRPPALQETADGDLRRINVVALREVAFVLNGEEQRKLCQRHGLDVPPPTLFELDNLTPPTGVDPGTGEISDEMGEIANDDDGGGGVDDEAYHEDGDLSNHSTTVEVFTPPPRGPVAIGAATNDPVLARFMDED